MVSQRTRDALAVDYACVLRKPDGQVSLPCERLDLEKVNYIPEVAVLVTDADQRFGLP